LRFARCSRVFSRKAPFLLFEPIETCANYAPLEGAIHALDWRMAWKATAVSGRPLPRGRDGADLKTDLIFLTDGQEAPPLPPSGPPPFEGRPGEVRGLIVGVGGRQLSPIPKYDDNGREIGFTGRGCSSRQPLRPAAGGPDLPLKATMRVMRLLGGGRRRRRTSFVRSRILSATLSEKTG